MGWNAKTTHTAYEITPAVSLETTEEAGEPSSDVVEQVPVIDEPELLPGQLPVTPIPLTPDVGHAYGEPVLVGGADLLASTATLVSYHTDDGPRTVLHARVSEEAEPKLLEALNINPEMVPEEVEKLVTGRLPIDEKYSVAEKVIAAAKSVKFHLKHGTLTADGELQATTAGKIDAAHAAIEGLAQALGDSTSPEEQAMLSHYAASLAEVREAVSSGVGLGQVKPFLHEGMATVTVMVPALPPEASSSNAVAILRDATRIEPHLDIKTGSASWDGSRSEKVTGKEYAIGLGDGYQAVYRPYGINDPASTEYSLRGRLEVIAPVGEGQGPELVQRLGRLHLANRPMTRDEGEHTYLTANIIAQGLHEEAAVKAAQVTGEHLEEMVRQELFYERAHQAVGMTDAQLGRFAKDIQLDAHTRALPAKTQVLREAVAKAAGFHDGAGLVASPGYDPAPRRSAGWLTWGRFDVGNSSDKLGSAVSNRSLIHTTSAAGLQAMLATGVLASTERRTLMGTGIGVGQSEDVDKHTGGASSVFLRVRQTSDVDSGPMLVWDRPERLLARADYYGANADTFGVVNPAKLGQYAKGMSTRDPFKIAGFSGSSNEVMFTDGIDLLGHEGPSRILCANAVQQEQIRSMLLAKGVTSIAGKPIEEVVTS